MGSLSQAKTLGGIGSILTLLLLVPYYVGTALVIIGWILILLALKQISEVVQDRPIYTNGMISVALQIVANIVFAVVVAAAILGFLGLGPQTAGMAPNATFFALIGQVIAGLFVVWILAIIASFFIWRSFRSVGAKLNMGLFGTAALIYFIGSILTIILVGFILTFIAQILFIAAFFTIKEQVQQTPSLQPQTMGTR